MGQNRLPRILFRREAETNDTGATVVVPRPPQPVLSANFVMQAVYAVPVGCVSVTDVIHSSLISHSPRPR
jgi:hypothetical protein